ncbi:MAG: family 10 glycosylhydrolase [Clostridia bacterium]|nr:family 10 glycosylhydrolase [Clostridia bacterium]
MKKRKIIGCIILLAIMFLSSCSGDVIPLADREVPSRLPYEEIAKNAIGLLNPDSEMRGIWIASVGNINFPSKQGLGKKALAAELDEIVENCASLGINTIFFQVRPASDALYSSSLFPASEYVSGKQGRMPEGDFDCLEYLINAAKREKIRVHAWVNPLRVTYGSQKYPKTDLSLLAKDHIARKNPHWVVEYADGKLYFDAGIPAVREYIAEGVREIVSNYDVDGIIFDDYFYPYPVDNAEFDDGASYLEYGGGAEKEDWRRENINALVKGCYEATKAADPSCLFGISPFGIWQNDDGKNGGSASRGLEAYESLYCDALAWIEGKYIDYISPQLYWRFETAAAPYGELASWWNAVLDGSGIKLYISHASYMYESWESPYGELTHQVDFSRDLITYKGSIFYGYEAIAKNAENVADEISKLFEDEIIYSDYYSTAEPLLLDLPQISASKMIKVSGKSDPAVTLSYEGKRISRERDGSFTIELTLKTGENSIIFDYGGKKTVFTTEYSE